MNEKDDFGIKFDSAIQSNDLIEAEIYAQKLDEEWQIAEALKKVAKRYLAVNQKQKAVELLNAAVEIARKGEKSDSKQNSIDSSSVLEEVSKEFALVGDMEKANNTAELIQNDWKRKRALENLEIDTKGGKDFH